MNIRIRMKRHVFNQFKKKQLMYRKKLIKSRKNSKMFQKVYIIFLFNV